ncbi:zinc finger protein 552-like [Chrysoperla carnea]|uniref:zinc finger protein 552-like n=1 Tax=Chrysoperla carnea TaxID=189513 RepID=UPI001D072741|nr:zinc finger protein 552-like [Chrysoperla carnea]
MENNSFRNDDPLLIREDDIKVEKNEILEESEPIQHPQGIPQENDTVKYEGIYLGKYEKIISEQRLKTEIIIKDNILDENGCGNKINKNKRFSCEACDRMFTHRSDLIKHLRIHTGEKPFPCDICGKAFAERICEKTFTSRSSLEYHELNHTRKKNVCCEICDKKFVLQSDLTRHKRSHDAGKL